MQNKTLTKQQDEIVIVDLLDKAENHLKHITMQNKTLIKQQDEIIGLLEVTSEIIDEASPTTNEQ
jgi:hypothetical protein